MPSAEKRERQRQNRDARRVATFEAEKRQKRNKTIRNVSIAIGILAVILVIRVLTNGGSSSKSSSSSPPFSSLPVACGAKAPPANTAKAPATEPPLTVDPAKTYTAVMKTSCGTITMTLDPKQAPHAVNSFVYLAKAGYYDGTLFHRIVTDFVNQGGDPTRTGTGGVKYTLPDEPPAKGYTAGSVAMAKGQKTSGSQFFLVVSDNGAKQLGGPPYQYSTLGTMDAASLTVAQKINTFGSADTAGKPTARVYVDSVTITES